jgi:phosphoglycerate dehydrogenase-like enzyme
MLPDLWIPERTSADERGLLDGLASIHVLPARGLLPDRLGHADILVAAHSIERCLEAIPSLDGLKVVQSFSAGIDSLIGRVPEGITLCDAAGVHDISVSEWAVMAILAVRRGLPEHVRSQHEGAWRPRTEINPEDLDGAQVMILGYGSIGRTLERYLTPFGVEVVRVARRARDGVSGTDQLPRLLPRVDIVVNLLPLTPQTRGLIDAGFLAHMRPGALLVNASRGAVVDTDALLEALNAHRIRAALDVTDPEPLPEDHPLWTAPGLLLTPHVAGDVAAENRRAWQLVADQVVRYGAGEPLRNVVSDGY